MLPPSAPPSLFAESMLLDPESEPIHPEFRMGAIRHLARTLNKPADLRRLTLMLAEEVEAAREKRRWVYEWGTPWRPVLVPQNQRQL